MQNTPTKPKKQFLQNLNNGVQVLACSDGPMHCNGVKLQLILNFYELVILATTHTHLGDN